MAGSRKLWNRLTMIIAIIIITGEITSLLVLDRLDGLSIRSLTSWTRPDNPKMPKAEFHSIVTDFPVQTNCEAWLDEADKLPPGRNFSQNPVIVIFGETQNWDSCGVGCNFKSNADNTDGAFTQGISGSPFREDGVSHILRSMESSTYYPENNLASAHAQGYDVVMTTSLASDVPVGYFSWAEYDIMAPVQRKGHDMVAAAFISNCAAHNFRLEALEELRRFKVNVDSFGKCHRNKEAKDKLETLRHYKFSLAFENSNEQDYVTEKFWQSLVAGSVPVVVGAPNIEDFVPAPNSFLHIKSIDDVSRVANQIRYLESNSTAYNETLKWKYEGPSNAFKALVDMATVHSSCRLCIHLATIIRAEEMGAIPDVVSKRPCKCTDVLGVVTYHIFVRERGRFEFESVYLRSTELSIAGLEAAVIAKFRSLDYVPVWTTERPEMIRGDGSLNIHKLYPVGLTQRDALYSVYFQTDDNVKGHLDDNPCPKLEVIFV
ncbi:unnamed protein product [Calypogeia fissa]